MPSMSAFAATSSAIKSPPGSGEALEIAPPIIELNGNPGQSLKAKIYLRDVSKSELIVRSAVNNFVASGLTGTPHILIKNNTHDPYAINNYVAPIPTLLLKPQQIKNLYVTINIPKDASPGGHYGVIRFTAAPPALNGSSGVSLSASIGALVLLTVSGHIVQGLQTHSFNVAQRGKSSSFFQTYPLAFNEIFKNTGNVQLIPTGLLTVKDMFGNTISQLAINREQGNVLPDSMRKFTENLTSVIMSNKTLFGRYSASFSVKYGSSKKTLTDHLTFWVIPLKLIAIWIVVLIGGFFLLRWSIKRYNRHILDKAQKPKPKK